MDDGRQLVQKVVWSLHYKHKLLHGRADNDIEDYLQAGYVGYLRARKKFDETKGSFDRYAWTLIRGAILDWNRSLAGRHHHLNVVYIDDIGREGMQWEPPDMKTPTAEQQLIKEENRSRLLSLMQHLREAYRHILTRYYFDHKTMKEIGKEVGLTESRICQIHEAALRAMELLLKKQPMREVDEMENNKRKLFDEMTRWLEDGPGITAEELSEKTGLKSSTTATYIRDFFSAAMPHFVKYVEEGQPSRYYYVSHGKDPNDVYALIRKAAVRPSSTVRTRKKSAPIQQPKKQEEKGEEIVRSERDVAKETVGWLARRQQRRAEPTQQTNVELVVKLRVQIIVEQITEATKMEV